MLILPILKETLAWTRISISLSAPEEKAKTHSRGRGLNDWDDLE